MNHLFTLKTKALRRFISGVASVALAVGTVLVPATSALASTGSVQLLVQDSLNQPIANTPVKTCNTFVWPQVCDTVMTDSQGLARVDAHLNSQGNADLNLGGSSTGYSVVSTVISFLNGAPQYANGATQQVVTLTPTTWATLELTLKDSSTQSPIAGQSINFSANGSGAQSTTNSSGVATASFDTLGQTVTSVTASLSQGAYDAASTTLSITNNSASGELLATRTNFDLSGSVSFNQSPVGSKTFSYQVYEGNNSICHNFEVDVDGNYEISNLSNTQVYLYPYPCNSNMISEYDNLGSFSFDSNEGNNQVHDIVLTQTGVELTVTEAGTSTPVKNLRVSLTPDPYSGYRTSAITDSSGVATFVGLQPGATYKASYVREQYDNSLHRYEERVNTSIITVGNRNTMAPASLVLTRLSSAPAMPVVITGRVVTGQSITAVVGASVRAYWSAQVGSSYQSYEQTVYTDAQGNYSISDFPYGNISIQITANGYRQTNTYFVASESSGTAYNRGTINLRPTPLGNLSYSGVLKDSSQNPIQGMRLWLYAAGGSGQPASTTTDSSGAFNFSSLTQGMYHLSADVWASDSIYQPFSGQSSSIDLTSSQQNVQLSLASRSAGNASISGRVAEYLDVNGESSATPLSGKTVYVWPKNGGQGYSDVTDANGEWSIAGLTNGQEYYVSAQYDYQAYESPLNNNLVTARSSGGSAHQLLLKRVSAGAGSLTGRVKDASDYSNLEGIQVQLYRSFGGTTVSPVTTDARGEYSFTNLPSGEYFMVIGGQDQNYKVSYMSVEIGNGSNRINALLSQILTYSGTISGRVLDDRGIPLSGASVEVWNTNDSSLGGYAQTNNDGTYEVEGLPAGIPLNFRVTPAWDLRYEVSSYLTSTTLSQSNPTDTIDVQLEAAAFITGTVSGIPASGNVPPVSVELIDSNSGTVMSVTSIRSENGVYTFASVPAGDYIIRYTQRANYQGYSGGGWGFASGGADSEAISLKPVYWDGSTNGTSDRTQAGVVTVAAGGRVAGKSVTVTPGSSIAGTVYVETPDGISRLTGTRSVLVYIYQKQADGTWEQVGYPEAANGYTNSEIKISGLGAGRYKLKFEDSRRGNNSLSTVFNGDASTLASAPEIVVTSGGVSTVSQTMSVAPPERSAEAIDLDDLGQQLSELENQITVVDELSIGSESSIYVGVEFAGEYVSAFANSTPTTLGGWKQVDSNGYISVVVPADLEAGSHRVAVQDANLKVVGWTSVTIAPSETEAGALTYGARKATSSIADSASSKAELTSPQQKPSSTEANSASEVQSESTTQTNNVWLLYFLGAALLVGVATAIWLIRSRRS